ncbi:hypothetical protein QYE76_071088 [Lolium multiflorum]|uniref:Uncharacterized protein n=1 Tax=Lolium multiflorum TaxID=4521 RepID=A0AAD8WEJ3_LOLMU|nr:hypothetical protein QYE76_071088 [Lolium multiflorum]
MRATKDNLSADAIDKRIRLLIKVPRELHVHVCNKDIHMNGSGTAKVNSELSSGFLPNTDPKSSEAEVHEAPRPPKRKKPAPSSPAAKRAREVPSTAATRKAEAEKKRLKLINTSNKGQPAIQLLQAFRPPGKSRHHGDSAKGASVHPPQDQPRATFAEPTEEQYEEKVRLVQATNAIRGPSTDSSKAHSRAPRGSFRHAEQEETAKHSSFDELSAKVKVLEAENESLKTFIQESSSKETEARKELSEKHARDLAELNEKLEKSQGRVISV